METPSGFDDDMHPNVTSDAAAISTDPIAGRDSENFEAQLLKFARRVRQSQTLIPFVLLIAIGATFLWIFRAAGKAVGTAALGSTTSAAAHLTLLAAVTGILAMAAIEFVKRLVPIRGSFQGSHLTRLIGSDALELLLRLSNRQRARILFLDSPMEQVAAQLNGGVQQILATLQSIPIKWDAGRQVAWYARPPDQGIHPADRADYHMLDAVVNPRHERDFPSESRRFHALNSVIGMPFFRPVEDLATVEGQLIWQDRDEARDFEVTLTGLLNIGLDSLQLSVSNSWRRAVRASAAVVSAGAAFGLTALSNARLGFVLTAASASFLFGGFFAWFARDIVAGVESWRR